MQQASVEGRFKSGCQGHPVRVKHKCIRVRIGEAKRRKLSKKRKLNKNKEKFINFPETEGI